MSRRDVWSCDLCGADCHIDAIRSFSDGFGHAVDVGPCCYTKPITDLITKFAAKLKQ